MQKIETLLGVTDGVNGYDEHKITTLTNLRLANYLTVIDSCSHSCHEETKTDTFGAYLLTVIQKAKQFEKFGLIFTIYTYPCIFNLYLKIYLAKISYHYRHKSLIFYRKLFFKLYKFTIYINTTT